MQRSERLLVLLVFALAAALGVQAALEWQAGPFGMAPLLDEEGYIAWARRIAAGEWLGRGVFYQDPLWPYVLAVCFRLTGGSLLPARLFQVGLGLGTLCWTFLLARRLFGKREAILASALLALCAVHAYYQSILLKATLAAHLAALALWLAARAEQQRRGRDFFALGAALAAFSLVRGNALALALIAALAALWPMLPDRQKAAPLAGGRARRLLWLAAGLAVVLLPVTLRNRAVGGEYALTTSQAGQNFYLGNSAFADGTYVALPFVRAGPQWEAQDFQLEAERRTGRALLPTEVSRFFLREALRWLFDHPAAAGRLWARKLWLAVHAYEIPDNESFACMRRFFMPSLWVGIFGWGALVGPAVAGMALALRERRAVLPVLLALTYGATLVAFFIVSRYRYPLLPAAAVFAAHFAVCLFDALRARHFALAGGAAGVAAAVALVAWLPSPISRRENEYLAHCAQSSSASFLAQDRPAEALPMAEEAVRLEPANGNHRFNLALARQKLGDLDGAVAGYRETLRLIPGDAGALRNLALIFLRERRCAEARALFAPSGAAALDEALEAELTARCGPAPLADPRQVGRPNVLP